MYFVLLLSSVMGWDVPLLAGPRSNTGFISFKHLSIYFGLISLAITVRLQDIIRMIMARANDPDGGLHLPSR